MSTEPDANESRIFYRRVSPDWWKGGVYGSVDEAAFVLRMLRSGPEKGLSVFDSAVASPMDCLYQQVISWENQYARNPTVQILSNLTDCRRSAAGLIDLNWGVVAIDESVFVELGLGPMSQPSTHGHLEIFGSIEQYQRLATDLVKASRNALAVPTLTK